ncbi:hypothetical protein Tco_1242302 [Tanacetum coccineum]
MLNAGRFYKGISIGIVTAIAAPASIKIDFGGNRGHAGATLMPQSRRINNDKLGKRHNMVRRRHGKRAVLQVVLILKAKFDYAPGTQDRWSPHMYHTLSVAARRCSGLPRGHLAKILPQQIGAILRTQIPNCQELRMTGPTSEPITPLNRVTERSNDHSPSLQDQILNHISSLETLIKEHNEKAGTPITPIRLTFGDEGEGDKGKDKGKGPAEETDEDLKKPYKEVLKSPFTRQIIEFSAPSYRMPTNLKIYDGSTDPDDHITRFVGAANQGEWEMPGVPEVMQISTFMSNSKCPELARQFADQVPQTVTEMMKRVDDFVKSEEAYKSTELPKGEHPERGQGAPYKGARPSRIMQGGGPPKMDGYNTYNRKDHYQPYVSPRQPGRRYDNRRFENRRQEVNQLGLEALVKRPKEILSTELQLQLPPCPPMIGTPKKENLDRYCDYHGEKGHYTNDCCQLKGNWRPAEGKKRKCQLGGEEDWMNVPITFPPVQSDDVSDEPLIIEAEVEGYLVRRVFVDQGAAVQVMFEHCFCNLPSTVQARLTRTHTELVGFSGEQLLPMGKIELEVMFGSEGLC